MGTAAKSWSVTLSPMPGEGERIVHTGEDAVALCRLFFSPGRPVLLDALTLRLVVTWGKMEVEIQCFRSGEWFASVSAGDPQRFHLFYLVAKGTDPFQALQALSQRLTRQGVELAIATSVVSQLRQISEQEVG